jgi:GNAT superfamily N-acetyltransferase
MEIRIRGLDPVQDGKNVDRIVRSSGFFAPEEAELAARYFREASDGGADCEHRFLFAEAAGKTSGFANFGPAGFGGVSWYLHWIAVDDSLRGKGIGRALLRASEDAILSAGGVKVFIETSSTELYRPTHGFYTGCGYRLEATLTDYYRIGDHQLIFSRYLA